MSKLHPYMRPPARRSFAVFASLAAFLGASALACGGSAAPVGSGSDTSPTPDKSSEPSDPPASASAGGRPVDPGPLAAEYFNVAIADTVHKVVAKRAVTWGGDAGPTMVLATGFEEETANGASSTSVYFPVNASGAVRCDETTRIEHSEAGGRLFSTRILHNCTINVITSGTTVTASFRGWIDNGSIPAADPVTVQGNFRIVQGMEAH